MINLVLGEIWPFILAIVSLIGFGVGIRIRQDARTKRKLKDKDDKHAKDIRDRVERGVADRANGVRNADDKRGYRD